MIVHMIVILERLWLYAILGLFSLLYISNHTINFMKIKSEKTVEIWKNNSENIDVLYTDCLFM